ncbi:MAG: Hpt domain-containing protein, partial [Clostridia bacterium]|nr:Hpt domain-containing protein [Clostridia bacterium]
MSTHSLEPMVDMYLFETTQQIEQLESIILQSEKTGSYDSDAINEIFRIMHTIKGSSGMMLYNEIARLAHGLEDLFYFIREKKPQIQDCSCLSDIVLEGIDFMKLELLKIKNGDLVDGNPESVLSHVQAYLAELKSDNPEAGDIRRQTPAEKPKFYIPSEKSSKTGENCFKAVLFFEEGCEMENIRAYSLIYSLKEFTSEVYSVPQDVIENEKSVEIIREKGFTIYIVCKKSYREMYDILNQTLFVKELELVQLDNDDEFKVLKTPSLKVEESPIKVPVITNVPAPEALHKEAKESKEAGSGTQSLISVHVQKLDTLMDLVGELVIAEAMVTQNPDLK